MKFIITVLCILTVTYTYSQVTISGTVCDEDKQPIEYFDVRIYTATDSTLLKGAAFMDGKFIISDLSVPLCIIKITSLGYQDFYKKIDMSSEQKNNYKFTLIKEEKALQEVVVLAQKPSIINKSDRYVVKIQNTSLSDAGNAINLLRRIPFVIVDNITKEISIAGRGTTMIMIDGRKIIGTQELETLNSQNIKDVEVIENPSAKYEAEGHAVINIITSRNENKGLNINLDASYQRGRHNNGLVQTTVTYALPKMLFFMQYGYTATNNEGFNSEIRNLNKGNASFSLISEDKSNLFKNRIHDYSFGINYTPAKNHFIGLKYNGFTGTVSGETIKNTEYSKNGTDYPLEILNHKKNDNPNRGNMNVNYTYTKNGYEFSFLSDYTYSNTKSTSLINEYDIAQSYNRVMNNDWKAKYNVFSAQFNLKIPLTFLNGGSIEFGSKYSFVESENESKFYKNNQGQLEVVPEFTSDILFAEKILGTYFMLSGKSDKGFRYSAGIRHEYLRNKNEERNDNVLKKTEIKNDFFPSTTISYSASKELNFRTSYSRRIVRPSYSTLNNSVWYINSFSSRQGNPDLKSSIYNTISLSAQWKKIIFSTTASYIQNPIDLLYINDSVQIEKHIVKSLNTQNRWSYSFNISASYSYKFWNTRPFFSFTHMERSIWEDGKKYSNKSPGFYFKLSNEFNLSKTSFADFDFIFNKPNYSFKEFINQYTFNFSFRQKLLKEKLTLQLSYEYTPTLWKQKLDYGYKNILFTWDGDNRNMLTISLKYKFNRTKKEFKSKESNRSELNRL